MKLPVVESYFVILDEDWWWILSSIHSISIAVRVSRNSWGMLEEESSCFFDLCQSLVAWSSAPFLTQANQARKIGAGLCQMPSLVFCCTKISAQKVKAWNFAGDASCGNLYVQDTHSQRVYNKGPKKWNGVVGY